MKERLDDPPSYACYDTRMLCKTWSDVFSTAIGGLCLDTWTHWMNDITRQVQKRTVNEGRLCLPVCFHRFVPCYVLNYLQCIDEPKHWVELTRGERESGCTNAGAMGKAVVQMLVQWTSDQLVNNKQSRRCKAAAGRAGKKETR